MAEDGTIANSILEMSRYATTAIALDVGRSEFALLREGVGVKTPAMQAFYHLGGMAAMLEVFGVKTLEELELALKIYVESFPKDASQ
jgi:hypothetical protein